MKNSTACLLSAFLLVHFGSAAFAAPSVYPTGVTRYDPTKAYNSYVVFTGQDKRTHLIDLNGNEVHQWAYEGFPPVLLDPAVTGGKRGHILLQLSSQQGTTKSADGSSKQALGELNWNGQVVWQWSGAQAQQAYGNTDSNPVGSGTEVRQHNDWRRLPNGNTVILVSYRHHVPGFKADTVVDDAIYEVSPQGDLVWQWVVSEHLNEIGFSDASLKLIRNTLTRNDQAAPFDYLHLNNLSVVGSNQWFDAGDERFNPDNLLIGSRNANFIAIIDKKTGKIVWRIGPDYASPTQASGRLPRPVDQIIGQHDGHIIPKGLPGAGHLLVFDNQGEAGYPNVGPGMQPRSRILEIDPIKKEIVWQYTGADSGSPSWSFYSSFISSARRLPNGNTLIDEGTSGRLFQVTTKGDIVWEYVSPYFGEVKNGGEGKIVLSNWIYRAQPVPYHWVPEGTPRSEKAVGVLNVNTFRVPEPK